LNIIDLDDPSFPASVGDGWDYRDNVFTIYQGATITVTGTTTTNRVVVNGHCGLQDIR